MVRLALHLLLAFSLALNGISAPWAMARMGQHAHAAHAVHAGGAMHPGNEAVPASRIAAAHAHHGDHGSRVDVPTAPDPEPIDGSCCDDSACDCGCVLPPVVSLAMELPSSPTMRITPLTWTAQPVLLHRGKPPLRPPAA